MDFKVSVSLWNQPQNPSMPATTPASVDSDFGQRLGLDQHAKPRQNDAGQAPVGQGEMPLADQPFVQAPRRDASMPGQPFTPGKVDPAAGVELYALGLQAGTRLSHMPAGLLASAEAAYRANGFDAAADAAEPQLQVPKTAASAPIICTPGRTQAAMPPPPQVSAAGDEPVARLNEGLRAWHSVHWPQRNYLLLPRSDGVELLIRDHHLDAQEQATLLGELLRRLPGSGVDAQRIWINGRPVWQRENLSRLQGDA